MKVDYFPTSLYIALVIWTSNDFQQSKKGCDFLCIMYHLKNISIISKSIDFQVENYGWQAIANKN